MRRQLRVTAVALIGIIALLGSGNIALPFEPITVYRGKMGSKADFFNDDEVKRLLMDHKIKVEVTSTGSRDVALSDLENYDFVFPSGAPAAELITGGRTAQNKYFQYYSPFITPLVLATFRPYAETLKEHDIAFPQGAGEPLYYYLDIEKFIHLTDGNARWDQLGLGRHGNVSNGNVVLAQTSDVCSSNSGGTYLGLVADTVNGGPASDDKTAKDVAARIKPWFQKQGEPLQDRFRTYTAPEGPGVAPVVVVYEHQYLAFQLAQQRQTGKPDTNRVLLYPQNMYYTEPPFISLRPEANRLGELITKDARLRQRALELGFRVLDTTGVTSSKQLDEMLGSHGIQTPELARQHTKAVMPSAKSLETMIKDVGEC